MRNYNSKVNYVEKVMLAIIGIIVVFLCVFVTYIVTGGSIGVVLHALPHEFAVIGGSGIGAYMVANKTSVLKATFPNMMMCFKGSHWKADDYKDLLTLMFTILKLTKAKGALALEEHLDNPSNSDLFNKYPRICADHFATAFICDTFRLITMNLEDPYQIEDAMQNLLDKHHHEQMEVGNSLQTLADATPALGIVAAVLGVIKTMSSIDQPPIVLGGMIGSALVGTFLGVFLSYGLIGPMASKIKTLHNEDHQFYLVTRDIIISFLKKNSPQVCIEIARGNIPTSYQPTFEEVETALNSLPSVGA
jgi:chemotaxis protein MotA